MHKNCCVKTLYPQHRNMPNARPRYKEIMNKFIICHNYGTPNAFPFGFQSAVAVCKVSCIYGNDIADMQCVYVGRNGGYGEHAELKLIEYLRNSQHIMDATEIDIKVYQNYSPCNDLCGNVSCAENIVQYKDSMERQGKTMNITILFANFYRTTTYSGNDEKRAMENRKGLRLLLSAQVKLQLLAEQEKWETFLYDGNLVDLSAEEKRSLLELAGSEVGGSENSSMNSTYTPS